MRNVPPQAPVFKHLVPMGDAVERSCGDLRRKSFPGESDWGLAGRVCSLAPLLLPSTGKGSTQGPVPQSPKHQLKSKENLRPGQGPLMTEASLTLPMPKWQALSVLGFSSKRREM